MDDNIVISGMGLVSACGDNVAENLSALKNKISGIKILDMPKSFFHGKYFAGQNTSIPIVDQELRCVQLSIIALQEALDQSGLKDLKNVALISSNTIGSMDYTETLFPEWRASLNPGKENLIKYDCGSITDQIAHHFNIAQRYTLSTACSSSANAFIMGKALLNSGKADAVIVGGVDGLTRFTINGFNALKIYDSNRCKPFSEDRAGLNLGEAAAYLVLQKATDVENNQILAEVVGCANANDAHHQTASSPDGIGATLAMKKALEQAGLHPSDIDYINAHGTATPNNDASEYQAIANVFKEEIPDYSSTKGYTGHTLAAAGAVEAVYSVLAILEQSIWPNIQFSKPMEVATKLPELEVKSKPINYVLSNSFGFGGNNTTLIFKKYVS